MGTGSGLALSFIIFFRKFFVSLIYTSFVLVTLSGCLDPTQEINSYRQEFARLYPNQHGYYTWGQRRIHYVWNGDRTKQALVFVHGSPGSYDGWAQFLTNTELLGAFFIIAIDRPGYGNSTPLTAEKSLANQAEAISAVLTDLEISKPAIWVGHSFGGPVVLRVAADHPEKVSALVLVSAAVDPAHEKILWYQKLANTGLVRWLLPKWLDVCNQEILPLEKELMSLKDHLPFLNLPVAVIHGVKDPLVPVGNVSYLKTHLKNDLLVHENLISEMNHYIPWRDPESIVQAVERISQFVY